MAEREKDGLTRLFSGMSLREALPLVFRLGSPVATFKILLRVIPTLRGEAWRDPHLAGEVSHCEGVPLSTSLSTQ